jgi:energy-coupling factor transport system permease protein
MPVLGDAIERSIALAAGMESRGFARTRGLPIRGALPLMLGSVLLAVFGLFLLLSSNWWQLGSSLLLAGLLGTAWGLHRAGRALRVTAHRPDSWGWRETLVAASGLGAAVLVLALGWLDASGGALHPSTDPLQWPDLTLAMLVVAGLTLAPLLFTRTRALQTVTSLRHDTRVRSLRPQFEPELAKR